MADVHRRQPLAGGEDQSDDPMRVSERELGVDQHGVGLTGDDHRGHGERSDLTVVAGQLQSG